MRFQLFRPVQSNEMLGLCVANAQCYTVWEVKVSSHQEEDNDFSRPIMHRAAVVLLVGVVRSTWVVFSSSNLRGPAVGTEGAPAYSVVSVGLFIQRWRITCMHFGVS
jgi:hypothetical protein